MLSAFVFLLCVEIKINQYHMLGNMKKKKQTERLKCLIINSRISILPRFICLCTFQLTFSVIHYVHAPLFVGAAWPPEEMQVDK